MAALYYFVSDLRAKFEEKEKGATAVEYGLLLALVAVVLVTALVALKTPMEGLVSDIGAKLTLTDG